MKFATGVNKPMSAHRQGWRSGSTEPSSRVGMICLGGVALSKRCTTPCATGILPVPGLAILNKRRPALAVPTWYLLSQDSIPGATLPRRRDTRPDESPAAPSIVWSGDSPFVIMEFRWTTPHEVSALA